MFSPWFSELVNILRETSLDDNADAIVNNVCNDLNILPDNIHEKDIAFIILGIMSSVEKHLDINEWDELDTSYKKYLNKNEDSMLPGKVKGEILDSILDYVSIKGGITSLEAVKSNAELSKSLWVDKWYPMSILDDLLNSIVTQMGIKKGQRCRDVGHHVCNKLLLFSDLKFYHSLLYSLHRIIEVVTFKWYSLDQETPSTINLRFDGNLSNNINEFIIGLCEGILDLRDIEADISVMEGNSKKATSILITHSKGAINYVEHFY